MSDPLMMFKALEVGEIFAWPGDDISNAHQRLDDMRYSALTGDEAGKVIKGGEQRLVILLAATLEVEIGELDA